MKLFNLITTSMLIIIFCSLNCLALEVSVIDGDTIKLDNKKIRLFGIDAPESKQKCFEEDNKSWDCGNDAKKFLVDLIGMRKVRCDVKAIDIYKREVAICYASEDELNRIMVQKGMAIAYREIF